MVERHSWHVALYVSARGLTTSPIPFGSRIFELTFDFIEHALRIEVSDGRHGPRRLEARSVADFRSELMKTLAGLGIEVAISDHPCEIPNAVAFSRDHSHASYDPAAAHALWQALVQIDRVLRGIPFGISREGQPGALLLGQLRHGRHALLRPDGATVHSQGAGPVNRSYARSLFA